MQLKRILKRADFELTKFRVQSYLNYETPKSLQLSPIDHLKSVDNLVNKLFVEQPLRVIVLTDPFIISPGGYSALSSFANALNQIGCEVIIANDIDELLLNDFKPNIILASDTPRQVLLIRRLREKIRNIDCRVGISVITPVDVPSIDMTTQSELYGSIGIAFLWGFKSDQFYTNSDYIQRIQRETNLGVISIEFGADLQNYYPIIKQREEEEFDFVFLASRNLDKWQVVKPILLALHRQGLSGVINGPGWNPSRLDIAKNNHMKYFSVARFGLNAHIPMSRNTITELNERCFNLMLSGLPQIVDDLPLLDQMDFRDKLQIYRNLDDLMALAMPSTNEKQAQVERSLRAYNCVMKDHTSLHRAHKFYCNILTLIGRN
jgi:hypothetical protein